MSGLDFWLCEKTCFVFFRGWKESQFFRFVFVSKTCLKWVPNVLLYKPCDGWACAVQLLDDIFIPKKVIIGSCPVFRLITPVLSSYVLLMKTRLILLNQQIKESMYMAVGSGHKNIT